MVAVSNLTKKYNDKAVVDQLSFSLEKGQIFALLGSNGAGKSTTIKMILGLVKKAGGEIDVKPDIKAGYSPETPCFPYFLTGEEVLFYYGRLQKLSKEEIKNIGELLEKTGLSKEITCNGKKKGTLIKHYSKGMLQRLALSQALLGNPDLLILDEPCAGLDAMGRIEMLNLLLELKEEGKTILMNSHILSDMEKICDCGIIMKDGKMLRKFDKSQFSEGRSLENIFLETMEGKKNVDNS